MDNEEIELDIVKNMGWRRTMREVETLKEVSQALFRSLVEDDESADIADSMGHAIAFLDQARMLISHDKLGGDGK
jgi:hypothetical protein